MSESIVLHRPRPAETNTGRHHRLVVRAILGLVIGALAFAIVQTTVGIVRAALPIETAAADPFAEFPRRELPREWRWERKAINFDHMFRQQTSPRLEWVRESGSIYRR